MQSDGLPALTNQSPEPVRVVNRSHQQAYAYMQASSKMLGEESSNNTAQNNDAESENNKDSIEVFRKESHPPFLRPVNIARSVAQNPC